MKMEKAEICGLKGIGPGTKKYKLIPLERKNQVTIGRMPDNDVVIDSSMISRVHAVLKKTNGVWTITDNKSLNGVMVNDRRLKPLEPCSLVDYDKIQLGICPSPDQPAQFVWLFKTKIKVKTTRSSPRTYNQDNDELSENINSDHAMNTNKTAKRQLSDDEDCPVFKKSREHLKSSGHSSAIDFPLTEKLAELSQNCPKEEPSKYKEGPSKESERLLKEMEQLYEQKLMKEKEMLEKIIAEKEIHNKVLKIELERIKTESALQTKSDILSSFTRLIECELQCSICTELFVKATTLNCSHSYCALCIKRWMKVKKRCPACRAPITSCTRLQVLDSYIDAVVEQLGDEIKERRKKLVEERQDLEMKEQKSENHHKHQHERQDYNLHTRPHTRSWSLTAADERNYSPRNSGVLTRAAAQRSTSRN